jgi:hypothetical protein
VSIKEEPGKPLEGGVISTGPVSVRELTPSFYIPTSATWPFFSCLGETTDMPSGYPERRIAENAVMTKFAEPMLDEIRRTLLLRTQVNSGNHCGGRHSVPSLGVGGAVE